MFAASWTINIKYTVILPLIFKMYLRKQNRVTEMF